MAEQSPEMLRELEALEKVRRDLANDNAAKMGKRTKHQAYQRSANKPHIPPADEK